MDTKHKVVIGDSRTMNSINDESVHLTITSPPYWQLKDYGTDKQIGFNDSYEEYINHLNLVWQESHRVLHKGCRLCVNIGDQFARSVYYGRYKIMPIRTEIIRFCETIGFDYMGAIIWQKKTTMNTSGGASIMGSFPFPRNGIIKLDYEFILIFKKLGKAPKVDKAIKEQSRMTTEEWNQYFTGHWLFPGVRQDKHLAMFPEELPKRLIKMFSFVGDTVLDPFLGSGTTSLAAKNLGRNSIGYEINPDFLPIIKKRIDNKNIDIIHQESISDFSKYIEKLPYKFKDPIHFDKKIDQKKLTFGSKIDKENKNITEYFTVKSILNSTNLILSNDLKVKLLGVKVNEKLESKAIDFLWAKTKGQRVFIKFDATKYDSNNNLLVYLYLKNKTFINAHLIKAGLADVDTNIEFGNKKRLLGYVNEAAINAT